MRYTEHVSTVMRELAPKSWVCMGLATTILAISGLAGAAVVTPFNYVVVDIFAGGPTDGTTEMSSSSALVFVERGAAPAAYGKARAKFGSTGFAFLSGAGGASMWSDGFLVTGGSGTSLINVSVKIDGSVVGPEPDMSYTLFASANPFNVQTILASLEIDDQNPQVTGAVAVLHTEVFQGAPQGALNVALAGTIPFTYGQMFYLASVFGGDVCGPLGPGCGGGSEDFFNSANFGITAPAGATLTALSETNYPAVPEPATWLLLCAGLISVFAVSRRRTRSQYAP